MTTSILTLPRYVERPSVRRLLMALGWGMSGQSVGLGLGTGEASGAVSWWLSGGISAANCIAAYQPIGAASLAASYVNLANPGTYNAAPGVAPTWASATGWTFNGAEYLTTGITPASGWSAGVRFSALTNHGTLFNQYDVAATNSRFGIFPSDSVVVIYQSGQSLLVAPPATSGILAIAGNTAYRNGVAETGTIGAWSAAATLALYIGARHREAPTNIDVYVAAKIQALAIYNTTLTPAQVLAVSNAMAALTG